MVISAFTQGSRALLEKFGLDVPDIRIEGLTLDSREVNTKLLFVAIKGHERDGREFIPQAISLGAKIILAQADNREQHGQLEMRAGTVIVSVFELPKMVSSLAASFFDYPAQKLKTVAVTGTNGKTSVVQLITQLKDALGHRCAAIGTLGSGVYQKEETQWTQTPASMTTPDAIRMQWLLADFVQHDVVHAAFEASSHALVQGRLSQVKTDVAVFTNLTRDHLDYHGTMDAYAAAKRELLNQPGLKSVVLNADDPESKRWAANTPDNVEIVWVSTSQKASITPSDCHCFATDVSYHPKGCSFKLETSWGDAEVSLPLLGEFNVSNVLAAIGVLLAQGERVEDVVKAVNQIRPVAGRMEVYEFRRHANVVVDFAHTPDALIKALSAIRKHAKGKLWCVFGCGGDRDKGKRPLMGAAAESGADYVVITTDNSRSESPDAIAEDILEGIRDKQSVFNEPDREAAIRYCLANAAPDDMVLVAGKGHEATQIIGNNKTNYNERAVVARLQGEFSE